MATRKGGVSGSVKGVPPEEVTTVLLAVAKELARGGLDYERSDARAAFEKRGIDGDQLDGFLFALQRSVPGVVSTGFGSYRLPENWKDAVRHRMWRFRAPALNILEAKELETALAANGNDMLGDLAARLRAEWVML